MFKKFFIDFPLFKKISRIITVILFAGIVIIYIFIGSNLFLVKEIEILNSDLIDKDDLWGWKDKNIFLVRVDSLMDKIKEIPEINYIVIKKELPNKLMVEVHEYIPSALLKENIKFAVSKEGVIFPFRGDANKNYPLLIYEKRNKKEGFQLGKPSRELEKAMKTYLAIKDIVPVGVINVKTDTEVFFLLKNLRTEIRMDSEEYEKEAHYLAVLMEQLPSKNVEYIDLRFGEDIPVKP
ncbi:MAG: cell division protein FtsQ/DivIB [Candidatus Ratteibacteria bacterium]|nr:cell division protein FtsQ/DivIB [Candidatus Ratteibacteria bacterium]